MRVPAGVPPPSFRSVSTNKRFDGEVMRHEKFLHLQARAAKNDPRVRFAEGHQFRLPEHEQAKDREGAYLRPRTTKTLLEKLIARQKGGGTSAP